jgi:ribosome-binding factor A
MKKGFDRAQRVGDMICRVLATMLVEDMLDDRFKLVTVMSASVSKDLSHAKIYVSVLVDDEKQAVDIVRALNTSAKKMRYNLANSVQLRIAPELKFVYDDTTARGFHLSGLIDNAMKKIDTTDTDNDTDEE